MYILNTRILRHLDHTPNELFFGTIINSKPSDVAATVIELSRDKDMMQKVYTGQQRLDRYA